MFTGIIGHIGVIKDVRRTSPGAGLRVDLGPLVEGLAAGDSVAVSGACLTASAVEGSTAEFDVVAETLARSTLGGLRPGAKVNLERALRLGDRLDGHLVQGHVDGIAAVRSIRRQGQSVVEFQAPPELTDAMVFKGSVAVDGVSLTLLEVSQGRFSVALIPTTLSETTMAELSPGREVNVETDLIGKYVRQHLECQSQADASRRLSIDKLRDAGFV